jgi:hypothetical protein
MPYGSHVERQWSRLVVDYITRHSRRYGWGNVDRNPIGRAAAYDGAELAARYLAKNAAGYLAANGGGEVALPGRRLRSYVSQRLTSRTGATMRNLRGVRYLYVCVRLGLPLPEWPDDRLEVVWRLFVGAEVAPAGP